MRKFTFFLMILVFITGCSLTNNCEDKICLTPPPSFTFEIIDAETGENLFTNGTSNTADIQFRDEENRPIDWIFISENDLNVISLGIGLEAGLNSYLLNLSPDLGIAISLQSEQKTENCCTFYEISEFSISPYEYEQSSTTGFFRVKI